MRTPAVTRNIKVTSAKVLEFDLEAMQTVTREIVIPAQYSSTKEAREKYLERCYKSVVNRKFLKVESYSTIEQLYGLKLEDFIKYAVPLTEDRKFPDGSDAE